jgi:hypothetical protein
MEQLKVGTNDLTSVANKKVAVATVSVSSMEAFPTVGLALQLEVPMVVVARRSGKSAGTLAWMAGWRRWRSIST